MNESLLALIPGLPLLGAIVNAVLGPRVGRIVSGSIASAAVGLSALLSFWVLATLAGQGEHAHPMSSTLWTWIEVGAFKADVAFSADPLTSVMMCVITGVGFLIHVYSVGYMDDEADAGSVWRFFSYLNLFVFAMLLLVMGDNLLVLFVGWEGVGLCSYLLIGFWYQNADFAAAGKKAFVTNRVGDFCVILGIFLLYWSLGDHASLGFAEIAHAVEEHPELVGGVGGALVTAVCLLLLGGVAGKSAQIPLYLWLPDAMAGPTPVSALIHAATMVTAGVYLVCRMSFLFVMSPMAMGVVALVGATTAFLAATIALSQFDIKKVLAYSTVSQLGYMVMAVGLGHFVAGFFHVITHAFFKALLFLGSGSIIHALHHEQDMRRMGGLWRKLPVTFATMTVGYLAIIGFPGFSGFFSKDEILWLTFAMTDEHVNLGAVFGPDAPGVGFLKLASRIAWGLGFATAGLTAYYMSRMYFMTFFGEFRGGHEGHGDHGRGPDTHGHGHAGHRDGPHESPPSMTVPLVLLAVASLLGGLLNLPHWLADHGALHQFLHPVFHHVESILTYEVDWTQEFFHMAAALVLVGAGVFVAWVYYGPPTDQPDPIAARPDRLFRGSLNKWYVDELVELLILQPIIAVSRGVLWKVVDVQLIDGFVNTVARWTAGAGRFYGRVFQGGQVQGYALAVTVGALFLVVLYAVR